MVAADPSPPPSEFLRETGVEMVPLAALWPQAQVLMLACPLTAATHRLLNEVAAAQLPDNAYIINVARGPLIAEAALLTHRTKWGGIALDVFEQEPLAPDSPLLALDGLIVGSHNASNTQEAVARVNHRAIANLLRDLEGDRL
ncbi:MAG: hypothetical protein HC918_07870 [Oscillatoriales cyanobacterium SM2_1_8]|nr:hypothetical protein [Oscillatoriales cyanobacterium SM2_1_8]